MNISITEATYNIQPSVFGSDKKIVLECDSTSNAILINLPTISGLLAHDLEIEISDTVGLASGNKITINAGGSDLINGINQDIVIDSAFGKVKLSVLSASNWGSSPLQTSGVILPAGVTAVHYGDGKKFTSVLTLTNVNLGSTTNASKGIGAIVMTLPAGSQIIKSSKIDIGLVGAAAIQADTPKIGLGSVIASGVVAVLSGTATFMDILTQQTASNTNGTHTVKTAKCTSSPFEFITESGGSKVVNLNAACAWAGISATVLASGTVVVEWSIL